MAKQKLPSPYRTSPANPKPGEWYYRSRYNGNFELTQHPLRWMVYDWTINPNQRMSEITEAQAVKILKTEKAAQKMADANPNYLVAGLYN